MTGIENGFGQPAASTTVNGHPLKTQTNGHSSVLHIGDDINMDMSDTATDGANGADAANGGNGAEAANGHASNGQAANVLSPPVDPDIKRRKVTVGFVTAHPLSQLSLSSPQALSRIQSEPELHLGTRDEEAAEEAAVQWKEMCDAAEEMEAARRSHGARWSRKVRDGLASISEAWMGVGRGSEGEGPFSNHRSQMDVVEESGGEIGVAINGVGKPYLYGLIPPESAVLGDLDYSFDDKVISVSVPPSSATYINADEHHHYGLSNSCKTKMICTLGPASRSVPVLQKLLRAGMNCARFNFSHGSHEYHQETLDNLNAAMANTGIMCATLLDTKGPEIRTGTLVGGRAVQLVKGSEVTLTTDYEAKGDANTIAISYKSLANDVKPGGQILCADGSISLTVLECNPEKGTVRCRCENSAMLGERKNVNLPGVIVDLPTVTLKDSEDILQWGVPNHVDFIAASFVRKGSDVAAIRKLLGPDAARSIHIISKVENQEGLTNFDDILRESDGIMVARGDLGMEIPIEKIFLAQKMMIHKCNMAGKPVVTATQMLESMIKFPRPTRAECTDVANAVLDGSDAVMLSGETAAGLYPVEAASVMVRICGEAESSVDHRSAFKAVMAAAPMPLSPIESLASSAVSTAAMMNASLILVLTRSGSTARLVSKYRPAAPVLSLVIPELFPHPQDPLLLVCHPAAQAAARHALLVKGLQPVLAEGGAHATDSGATNAIVAAALKTAKAKGQCKAGDAVVVVQRIGNASAIRMAVVA